LIEAKISYPVTITDLVILFSSTQNYSRKFRVSYILRSVLYKGSTCANSYQLYQKYVEIY